MTADLRIKGNASQQCKRDIEEGTQAEIVLQILPMSQSGHHSSLCNQATEADLRALGTALLLQACILRLQ